MTYNKLLLALTALPLLVLTGCGDDTESPGTNTILAVNNPSPPSTPNGGASCNTYCATQTTIDEACPALLVIATLRERDCLQKCEASPNGTDFDGLARCIEGLEDYCDDVEYVRAELIDCYERFGDPSDERGRFALCQQACQALSAAASQCFEGVDNDICEMECVHGREPQSRYERALECLDRFPQYCDNLERFDRCLQE